MVYIIHIALNYYITSAVKSFILHYLLSQTVDDILLKIMADVVVLAAMLALMHDLCSRMAWAIVGVPVAAARRRGLSYMSSNP